MWAGRAGGPGTRQSDRKPHTQTPQEGCVARDSRLSPTESGKGTCGGMRALCLLLLLGLGLLVSSKASCSVDEAINEKIREGTSSLIFATKQTLRLDCRTVTARGDLATCPEGFGVTGCTCGSACGSWDVRGEATCHCQCAGMDWTGARCCRLQAA